METKRKIEYYQNKTQEKTKNHVDGQNRTLDGKKILRMACEVSSRSERMETIHSTLPITKRRQMRWSYKSMKRSTSVQRIIIQMWIFDEWKRQHTHSLCPVVINIVIGIQAVMSLCICIIIHSHTAPVDTYAIQMFNHMMWHTELKKTALKGM